MKKGFTLRRTKKNAESAAGAAASSPPSASTVFAPASSVAPVSVAPSSASSSSSSSAVAGASSSSSSSSSSSGLSSSSSNLLSASSPSVVRVTVPSAPPTSSPAVSRPPTEELNRKMTMELKGRLLDVEQRASMYKSKISSFLEAISPFVSRLKASSDESDELVGLFLSEVEKLARSDSGESFDMENAIQRQARLEALNSAIREQIQTVSVLAESNTAASGPPSMSADFQGLHTPFILAHFVMEKLDKKSLGALAATSKQWCRRALQYVATRVRTNLLLNFVKQEQNYASELNLGLQTYGRAMEKHGLVDKTVIFLNIPVLRKASTVLVSELRERLVHFSPSQIIGDVFVRWGPAFDMLLFFSSRLDSSLKLLKSLLSRNDANQIISAIAVRLGRDAQSFLVLPVKRAKEMRDFLTQVLKSCPSDHPDVPHLQRAEEQMQSIVEELDKRNKVESALDHIVNLPSRVKEMGVSVLREGPVGIAEGPGRLFLCSACIILAVEEEDDGRDRLVFSSIFDFKPTPPVVLSSTDNVAAFDLQTSQKSTAVQVKTVEERISWMQSIKTAIDAHLRKSSALNVFAARKSSVVSSSSSRAASLTVSRKAGIMLKAAAAAPAPSNLPTPSPSSSKKMLTLGRSKSAVKGIRGLQKRFPLVDLPPGTCLYQFTNHGRVVLLDVHPASLSSDGVYVLITPNKVFCHCGPKVSPNSRQFALALSMAHDLASSDRVVHIADQVDEQFWALFGARFKLNDPTPKEVLDRYASKFSVFVIHSDMRMMEEDAKEIPNIVKDPCHFVFDAKDDVYVWIASEAPFLNKTVALAKADEVFNTDLALRPASASIIQLSESDRVRNPVFEMIVRLISDSALAQSVAEGSAARPLSFSEDPGKRDTSKGQKGASRTSAKVALSNPPARDWSAFECEREFDPQMERVSERLSPRQAAALAVQTMALANGVPSARTPRTVMRSHRAQLDQMLQMLDEAPTAASPDGTTESFPVPEPAIKPSPTDVEISYSGDSDSDDVMKTPAVEDAIEAVYAEFSEDTKVAEDDEVISILEAAVINE